MSLKITNVNTTIHRVATGATGNAWTLAGWWMRPATAAANDIFVVSDTTHGSAGPQVHYDGTKIIVIGRTSDATCGPAASEWVYLALSLSGYLGTIQLRSWDVSNGWQQLAHFTSAAYFWAEQVVFGSPNGTPLYAKTYSNSYVDSLYRYWRLWDGDELTSGASSELETERLATAPVLATGNIAHWAFTNGALLTDSVGSLTLSASDANYANDAANPPTGGASGVKSRGMLLGIGK